MLVFFFFFSQPKPLMIKTDSTEDASLSGYGGVSGAVVSFSMGDGKRAGYL